MRRQSVGVSGHEWWMHCDMGEPRALGGVVPWARVCLGCARHSAVAGRCAVEGRAAYRCRADPWIRPPGGS